MGNHFKNLGLAAVFVGCCVADAQAQGRANKDEFPFSIMRSEPGEPRAAPRVRRETAPAQVRPTKNAAKATRRVRRGSSTLSTIPTYRSPLTPLGTAPRIGDAPSMANPASPAAPVPGISATTGTAVTPRRPAGQGFQDRAVNCVQSGSAQGVGPGQIGAFTQNCVNR